MARPRKQQIIARPVNTGARVIAYLRVSTAEQGDSGLGLDAQRSTIAGMAAIHGWADVEFVEEIASGGKDDRPVLCDVLRRMDAGEADVLVVAKLDRLSRRLRTLLDVVDRATAKGWHVVLGPKIDTNSTEGRGMIGFLGTIAEMERGFISDRTKAALAAKKAQGVRLGRPSGLPQQVRQRIADERRAGATLQKIADGLMADGVATSRGGCTWRPAQVQAVLIVDGLR